MGRLLLKMPVRLEPMAFAGLASTDVVALAINGSNGHIFAETHSIMGDGGGMFRSTDNGDTWTEQIVASQHST